MAATRDSFVDLERHRQLLEENVKKLSDALDHWKQWKSEYEALRAEVKTLPPAADRRELRSTREKFQAELYHELLNEKELVDIFGRDDAKKPDQIVSALTNRLDYVGKNVDTLTKQLEEAQNKLAAVTVVSNPDATDEDGLPITEIMEELDDDDNVVSFSLRRPGDSQPQLLEALKKAGISNLPSEPAAAFAVPEVQDSKSAKDESSSETASKADLPSARDDAPQPSQKLEPLPNQPKEADAEKSPKPKPVTKKKSVTFSEDTKAGEQVEQSDTAKRLEEILQKARDQQSIISDPVLPADESPEDRELREHMIRYNKDTMEYEMGPIVAELQMEEGSTGGDTDEFSDFDDDDDEDDEEDRWGRSKVNYGDDWNRKMLELKERLSHYTFDDQDGTEGEDASDDEGDMIEGIGRITIRPQGEDTVAVDEVGGKGTEQAVGSIITDSVSAEDAPKKVRFAQSLDIAESAIPDSDTTQTKQPRPAEKDPYSDVVERSVGSRPVTAPTAQPKTKKMSRFRKARQNEVPVNAAPVALDGAAILPERPNSYGKATPSGPEGQTLADSVLEHTPSSEVREPDEFDADILQKQVAEEYQKKRNRLIHRQGGFMKEDENPIQPLDEEEGGPKRMSRFKAARLGLL
ncbi:hypothetical protein GGR52DRAFT_573954 [Hypoxylon sp. FL1284]|nr:hypothetical protein GGR52DRAFT_573954 [Hypoxylon sp. FL1284]